MNSIWASPPLDDHKCYCYHPEEAHSANGSCTWSSYGELCPCNRYRSLAQIKQARREERFWASVGGHEW